MSKCLYCGAELSEGERFCPECGQPVKESESPKPRKSRVSSGSSQKGQIDSILMLVMGILLALFAVFFVVSLLFGNTGGSENESKQKALTKWDGTVASAGSDSAGPESIVVQKSGSSGTQTSKDEEEKPEEEGKDEEDQDTEEEESEESEKSEETTASEPKVNTYLLVEGDYSWEEAYDYCGEFGGHLVTITSQEEYDAVCEVISGCDLTYLWIGATCDENGEWTEWITGESFSFDKWYPGEPTGTDGDGTLENCLCMWNVSDAGWTFNDLRNNLISAAPSASGKVGFVIEFE